MADAAQDESNLEKPENFDKWWSSTDRSINHARNLTRDLLISLRKNQMEEAGKPDAGLDQVVREQKQKKERVYNQAKEHMSVITTSYDRMQEVERSITQTVDSVTQLTHERYKGFAHLQICELRQELREKRPPPELFQDILSDALDAEKALLETQRQELLALEEEGKKIIEELNSTRAVLSRKSGERRVCILHDISSLNHKVSKPGPKQEGSNEETETAPGPPAEDEEEKKRSEDSKEAIRNTMKLLQRFNQHRSKSLDTVARCRDNRMKAKTKSEECLTTRVQQLGERKVDLDGQLRQVKQAIVKAERELESSYRKLAPGDQAKAEKLSADTELLEKLKKLRDKVSGDLKNKSTTLEIENTCKRVNAAKAGEADLKKKTALLRCNSAPTLKKSKNNFKSTTSSLGDGGLCDGSPGGSRSLKAGAAAGLGFQ